MNKPSMLAALLLGLTAGHAVAGEIPSQQPHIVVYLSDDHSQIDASLYGAADIPTPHFENLAADGMTFSHAFVASPSCAPSRAAMLTGLMPARNGAEENHSKPRPGTHCLVSDLQQAGYEVVACGKVAHGDPAPFGFDKVLRKSHYAGLKQNVTKYLQNRTSEKPLCLFVGISNPHVPWPVEGSFDPTAVEIPPTHLDLPSTRKYRALYYEEIKQLDKLLGVLRTLASEHLGDNVLFLHTSDHGAQWPFGKWTLYDYGIRVPMIAAWPGVIEPDSKSNAMVQWIDLLPTLIELAGGETSGDFDGKSFASVLQGDATEHRERIFTTHSGDGRMNVYPIRSVRTRDWKLIHNLHPEFAFTTHIDLVRAPHSCAYWTDWVAAAKTDPQAKAVVDRYYERPEWELYDLSDDPAEQRNLAENAEQAQRLAELKRELSQWMETQGDQQPVFREPRPLSEPETWRPDLIKFGKPKRPAQRKNKQRRGQP